MMTKPARKQLKSRPSRELFTNLLWNTQVSGLCDSLTTLSERVEIEGFGPDVIWSLRVGTRNLSIALTAMTVEELAVLKETIDKSFALAAQISLGRDKKAEEHSNAGSNETFRRLYRPIPQIVTGPGARAIDVQGLLDRPVDVPADDQ